MTNCKIFPHCPPHCGCPAGADTGTVITMTDPQGGPAGADEGAQLLAAHPAPAPQLSIDRILELRSIAMDVALSAHGTEAASEAASAAMAEAESYEATPTHVATVTQSPERNRVLAYAGDVIRARGWCQRDWAAEDGAVCLMTAVRIAACGDDAAYDVAVQLVLNRIATEFGQSIHNAAYWNDASVRTVGDVLRILR